MEAFENFFYIISSEEEIRKDTFLTYARKNKSVNSESSEYFVKKFALTDIFFLKFNDKRTSDKRETTTLGIYFFGNELSNITVKTN